MTIRGLYNKISAIDTDKIAAESMAHVTDEIVTYTIEQLLEGKKRTGQDITPSYLNDPYFKSTESAQRYSNWKDAISPRTSRKSGTPNLFINGYYHNTIEAVVRGDKLVIHSSFDGADDIERKYGGEIYGLNKTSRAEFIPLILRPVFMQRIKAATGLKVRR
jgi:hypothetical protein